VFIVNLHVELAFGCSVTVVGIERELGQTIRLEGE